MSSADFEVEQYELPSKVAPQIDWSQPSMYSNMMTFRRLSSVFHSSWLRFFATSSHPRSNRPSPPLRPVNSRTSKVRTDSFIRNCPSYASVVSGPRSPQSEYCEGLWYTKAYPLFRYFSVQWPLALQDLIDEVVSLDYASLEIGGQKQSPQPLKIE